MPTIKLKVRRQIVSCEEAVVEMDTDDLGTVLSLAEAFLAMIADDDDLSRDEIKERDEQAAAVDRVSAWLTSLKTPLPAS